MHETISGCYGQCVDALTCLPPPVVLDECETDADCSDMFCGWNADSNRVCKDFAQEGESCQGFVRPEFRAMCDPDLTCVLSEPTGDVPGTCMKPIHSGLCGDGSAAVCLSIAEPCDDGLTREIVNGCWGQCVSPLTCLPPPLPL